MKKKLVLLLATIAVLIAMVGPAQASVMRTATTGRNASTAKLAAPTVPDPSVNPHYFGPFPNYANSQFTLPDAGVAITGDGVDAEATATVGADGAVTGFTITNPGSGYVQGTTTVDITGSGSGATGSATVNAGGSVTAVTVGASGAGYTAPQVTISGGGATEDATATAYGKVDAVTLIDGGTGYVAPTVEFDQPDDPNGVKASASVQWDAGTGTVTGITLVDGGSGYTAAPGIAIIDGTIFDPTPNGGTGATASTTMSVSEINLETFGLGYTGIPSVDIADSGAGTGSGASATASTDLGSVVGLTLLTPGSGYVTSGGIKKFQDGLPVLCDLTAGPCTENNLNQHIAIGVPDTTTFPGADYYVIALVQHRERMSSSLPVEGTLSRTYVQLQSPGNASETWNRHIPLTTDLVGGGTADVLMPDGSRAIAVDDPHNLGPIIVATKDRPVRITFYNLLPTGEDGNLFLPTDTSMMGSGMGPVAMDPPVDEGTVTDAVRNPMCDASPKDSDNCFRENRATLHLHGGMNPWISDGTPHQWITPANEDTPWPQGVSVQSVPDMTGVAGVPDCTGDRDGCSTFYYTNQQSARLMFYHDHAWGITRLNVYAGEAAGYLITDDTEKKLINDGTIPTDQIPLIIQDKTFVPDASAAGRAGPDLGHQPVGDQGQPVVATRLHAGSEPR